MLSAQQRHDPTAINFILNLYCIKTQLQLVMQENSAIGGRWCLDIVGFIFILI